jgi:hypothetical protein
MTTTQNAHLDDLGEELIQEEEEAGHSDDRAEMSISEHKIAWMTCEERKAAPKQELKEISKKQRASTKALRVYMEENELDSLDCGGGWSMTHESIEKVGPITADMCESYMDTSSLNRLKEENKKRKSTFKIVPPPKQVRVE